MNGECGTKRIESKWSDQHQCDPRIVFEKFKVNPAATIHIQFAIKWSDMCAPLVRIFAHSNVYPNIYKTQFITQISHWIFECKICVACFCFSFIFYRLSKHWIIRLSSPNVLNTVSSVYQPFHSLYALVNEFIPFALIPLTQLMLVHIVTSKRSQSFLFCRFAKRAFIKWI